MIKYALKCEAGHMFESWFQSASAFDRLKEKKILSCAVCGITQVEKALMAPSIPTRKRDEGKFRKSKEAEGASAPVNQESNSLSMGKEDDNKLRALREHFEREVDYVGSAFANEARMMHLGEVDHRPIWGEASVQDAKELKEEGIPVAPLPFVPKSNQN